MSVKHLATRASVLALLAVVVACQPTTPPPGANDTPPPSAGSGGPSATAVAGPPIVTVAGGTTTIVGTGQKNTPDFDLAAGVAHVTVSTCSSNGVIPFVTLYDGTGGMIGFIVDAASDVKNLKGGKYRLGVSANPDCTWTVTLSAS